MRRRTTLIVLVITALLATIGLTHTQRFTMRDDSTATSQLAVVAPTAPVVAPRDVENKAGPLVALAIVLVLTAALTTRRRRVVPSRAGRNSVRVASRGWSRRGPPQLLVSA